MDRLSQPLRRFLLPAFAAYGLLAIVQTWPLALCLSTHVTGIPGGDTGVYVWNTWVFRYELVEQHRWPFSTTMVLPLAGPASLGLHNYTAFADLLTVPLQPVAGVIASFNLVYMLGIALAGLGLFVLAHHVTRRPLVAWIAGAMFATSPFLVARGTAHFSLAAAAPLPFFLYWFDRTWQRAGISDAVLAGAMVAWAGYTDPYYAIYCAVLAVVVILPRICTLSRTGRRVWGGRVRRTLDVGIFALVVLMGVVHGAAGGAVRVGAFGLAMHTLYSPMMALAALVTIRVVLTWTFDVEWHAVPRRLFALAAIMIGATAVLLAPELYALAELASQSRFVRAPVLWRSSAPGADLVTLLLPNPNHVLAPSAVVEWVSKQPGRFEENVLSVSWVAVGTILAAHFRAGLRVWSVWLGIAIAFGWLALGPFVIVGGYQTHMPTPWTFLRYVPVIGDARMPQRFGILMFLGLSVLFARALVSLSDRYPSHRRMITAVIGMALAVELLPAPRQLFAASVPSVYRTIAEDPRPVRILDMPFGIRDGLSSLGDFGPGSQLYQTEHHKALLGGYLSRVDERTKDIYRQHPYLSVLLTFSENGRPTPDALARAADAAPAFVRDTRLGYVVIDRDRVPPDAQRFLIVTLGLHRRGQDGALDLYSID